VRDAALLLDVLAEPVPGDPYFALPAPHGGYRAALQTALPRLRVSYVAKVRDVQADAECVRVLEHALRVLGDAGHAVEPGGPSALDEPEHIQHYLTIVACNTARALEVAGTKVGRSVVADDVEPLTWALAEAGKGQSAVGLLGSITYTHAFGRRLAQHFEQRCDVLLTPTLGALPPEVGHLTSTQGDPLRALLRSAPYGAFTLPWNMAGMPAISLPLGFSTGGLPIGVQLVAAHGREDLLLQLSRELEERTPWAERKAML
jgi:amidase